MQQACKYLQYWFESNFLLLLLNRVLHLCLKKKIDVDQLKNDVWYSAAFETVEMIGESILGTSLNALELLVKF